MINHGAGVAVAVLTESDKRHITQVY